MTRHFFGLFLLIILTLAAASWAQDKLLNERSSTSGNDDALRIAAGLLHRQLNSLPAGEWRQYVGSASGQPGLMLELFDNKEIAGDGTIDRIRRGEIVHLQAGRQETWSMLQFDAGHVLALKSKNDTRDAVDWATTAAFYALIALVLMLWMWPLARDLRALESATAMFGARNWNFNAKIKPHSPIHRLTEAFRRMAARIDELVGSQKHMTNALSHEIKTPLARMQFELEFASQESRLEPIKLALDHIKGDINAINRLVKATMEYAILERAELEINIGRHDFTAILPAIVADVRRDAGEDLSIRLDVPAEATAVRCDAHLLELMVRNLLNNARRYARSQIAVHFSANAAVNRLIVEDDGPGIAQPEQARVFDSFVKLDRTDKNEGGFGLGLAIVKRAVEWHDGQVTLSRSALGGARFELLWPTAAR